jgi:hypothetical protein
MLPTEEERKRQEAYESLETAMRKVFEVEEYQGLLTDWCVLAALQTFDDEGHCPAAVVKLGPYSGMPYYRLMGLVDYAHAAMHNVIVDETQIDGLD